MPVEAPNIRSVFDHALEIASPVDRRAYLDAVCAAAPEIRKQVEALLNAYANAGSFLRENAVEGLRHSPVDAITERPGMQVGPYKLLEQIGEGGFGVVFMAEQERPVKRRVALKVIKPGMDTRQVIARFEAERQALAMMDHPNIAKVYDAGATENGRPYFVMELVQGVPITEYCDQCNLSTRERLELFASVCQAVQHAHQKGIIHRDLKPTNVMVSIQDGRAAPKIIDFGVAKAMNQRLTEHTLATGFAQIIGTPLYMSPEQAELSPLGVDTRGDIYSLGVVLYELLTGTVPFEKERLQSAPFDELRRIIREEEPPRPSARISTLEAAAISTIAERRHTDARHLRQTIRGELDWIVMKCLEKDRNRRYETANGLSCDIERYLRDEPVQACPPSTSYRFRKFAVRNRTLLAAGGAIAAALIVGLGLSTWMYFRAATESARAQAVSDLLQEMLGSADAERAKGRQYTVREMLDDFSAGLGNQLADQPAAAADVHATIGRAYRVLRLENQAEPHFEKAIQFRSQVDGPQHENVAALLVDYAWNLHGQQRYSEAESYLDEALEIYRRRGVSGAPVIYALRILQHVLVSSDRKTDAERVTREAMAIASRSGEELRDFASILHRYAELKRSQGHYTEAEDLARQAVDMHHRVHGDEHLETAWGYRTLGSALQSQQKLEEAASVLTTSLAIFRHHYPNDHATVRSTVAQLREVFEARGDQSALEGLAKEDAEIEMRSDSPDYHLRVAGLLLKNNPTADQKEEARRLIRWAIEEYDQVAIDHPDDLDRRLSAAEGYVEVAKLGSVRPDFADEVEESHRRFSAEIQDLLVAFPNSANCQWRCAMLYRGWAFAVHNFSSYVAQEEQAYREAIKLLDSPTLVSAYPLRTSHYLASTQGCLGDVLLRSGRLDDAEKAFRRAIRIYGQRPAEPAREPAEEVDLVDSYCNFACLLATNQRHQEAADVLREAAPAAERIREPGLSASALACLAIARLRLGDQAGYREACAALVKLPFRLPDDDANLSRIRVCCLGPNAVDDPSVVIKLAEDFAANNSLGAPHLGHVMLGVAHFRAGHYKRAAQHLEESLAQFPGNAPPNLSPDFIMPQLLLAMAKWQLGEQEEARRILRELQPRIDERLRSPSTFWDRRAVLEIRRREAEAMIKPKEADEAVEK